MQFSLSDRSTLQFIAFASCLRCSCLKQTMTNESDEIMSMRNSWLDTVVAAMVLVVCVLFIISVAFAIFHNVGL